MTVVKLLTVKSYHTQQHLKSLQEAVVVEPRVPGLAPVVCCSADGFPEGSLGPAAHRRVTEQRDDVHQKDPMSQRHHVKVKQLHGGPQPVAGDETRPNVT